LTLFYTGYNNNVYLILLKTVSQSFRQVYYVLSVSGRKYSPFSRREQLAEYSRSQAADAGIAQCSIQFNG